MMAPAAPGTDLTRELERALMAVLGPGTVVTGLRRVTGGTTHDSWAFDAQIDGRAEPRPLILRRNLSAEVLDLPLPTECALLDRLHDAGIAVPKPLFSGDAQSPVGTEFAVLERFERGDIRKLMAKGALDPKATAQALVALQAEIHALDWARVAGDLLPPPGPEPDNQIAAWSRICFDLKKEPDPLLIASIDWLQANAPDGGAWCLVHGDFKANNLVMSADGSLAAIDWELCHIGDPLEDLAWTMLWTTAHDLVGGMLAPEDYLAAYASKSGREIDPERLGYWRLFVLVKLAAVFLRSLHLAGANRSVSPTHHLLLRAMPWLQRQMAERLTYTLNADH